MIVGDHRVDTSNLIYNNDNLCNFYFLLIVVFCIVFSVEKGSIEILTYSQ